MNIIEKLENEIKGLENRKIELLKELEFEKQKTEIEYSIENDEEYFVLWHDGYIRDYIWDGSDFDKTRYSQGNVFKTKEEAERESDRRTLLTRFRQFRDKCNGDWKPNFKIFMANKYNIGIDFFSGGLEARDSGTICELCLFGYFKNKEDCDRAIELFGDEIKRLFVEEAK